MGLISRFSILASALLGTAVASQAPEFAQQYRQRLGGAIEELRVVVEDFDRDARNSELDRSEALERMGRSGERFIQDRGTSMMQTIGRFEQLAEQRLRLENAPPLLRPLIVMRSPDSKIVEDAWQDFEPALPLTSSGVSYAGAGALLLGLLAWLGVRSGRRAVRFRRDRQLAAQIREGNESRRPGDT